MEDNTNEIDSLPPGVYITNGNQAIYNIYGIKVASCPKEIDNLLPGVYITNGKKIVIK